MWPTTKIAIHLRGENGDCIELEIRGLSLKRSVRVFRDLKETGLLGDSNHSNGAAAPTEPPSLVVGLSGVAVGRSKDTASSASATGD